MRSWLARWLWPTWAGLAVPGFWVAYVTYVAATGRLGSGRATLVALWPAVPLYAGSCLLAQWERRGANPALGRLLAVGVLLAAVDLAIKGWIEAVLPYGRPWPLLPGLLTIDRVDNVYGTMLAIPGAKPFITALSLVLLPTSVAGYRHYVAHEEPVAWGHAAFVGLFAGALGKAGDLLWRGLVVDYLHIPGLPIADLADVYLLWVGGGCALATWLHPLEGWPSLLSALKEWAGRLRRR